MEYLVCNIVGLIPCLDTARAEITRDSKGEEIFILRRIALDEASIRSYNNSIGLPLKIFRLKESPKYIIIHSDVMQAMTGAGIQGIEFRKPGEAGDFL
ncbi:MAG: hypothetical protein EHM28_11640 [Spirochaetaceae bacterium]|nr:MAG: hypothetical protein EHM28_11640 [Spirochaetaceae bacterium]